MIHAVAWVYHRPDAGCMSRKENSHTESPGPNRRARFRSAMSKAELAALLLNPDRPDVVFIARRRQEAEIPGGGGKAVPPLSMMFRQSVFRLPGAAGRYKEVW